jgi:hypothetical protein
MHYLLKIITYANDKKEAKENAKNILDCIVGEYKPFDYHCMDDSSHWNLKDSVLLADSEKGKTFIKESFEQQKEEFKRNLEKIRQGITKYSNEELLEEKDGMRGMFKYFCFAVGKYRGSGIYLYDHEGEGIRNTEHLNNVLAKWNKKEYDNLKVYVVLVDAHS